MRWLSIILLSIILLFGLSSCAWLKSVGPGLINCAEPVISSMTSHAMQPVRGALRQPGYSLLDVLLGQLGPAVICAAATIARGSLEADLADPVVAQRAAIWLKDRGYQPQGVP
jgi:hypothetical protein